MMSAETSPTVLFTSRLAERVRSYRRIVAKVASGSTPSRDDDKEASRSMRLMGLPDYAFRRDVRAWRAAATADEHGRVELLWGHGHLFDDADAWAEARIRSVDDPTDVPSPATAPARATGTGAMVRTNRRGCVVAAPGQLVGRRGPHNPGEQSADQPRHGCVGWPLAARAG